MYYREEMLEIPREGPHGWGTLRKGIYMDPILHWREGNGTPLQYSCLENPMDGGAWWATVPGVEKSDFTFTFTLILSGPMALVPSDMIRPRYLTDC